MNKTYLLLSTVIIIFFSTPLISQTTKILQNTPTSPTSTKNTKTINLGVITPISGNFSDIGQSAANLIKILCDKWNKENKPTKVNCIFEDDAFDAKKGLTAYLKLKQVNNIDALINLSSLTIDSISGFLRKDKIPTTQVFLESAPKEDNIFQICPELDEAEIAYGKYLSKKYPKDITLFVIDASAVTRITDPLKQGYTGKLTEIRIPADSTDVKSLVLKLASLKPSAVYLILTPAQFIAVEREMRRLNLNIPKILDNTFISAMPDIKKEFGNFNSYLEADIFSIELPQREDKEEIINNYTKTYKIKPAAWWELSYDSFFVIMNSYDPNYSTWVSNIKNINFAGMSGDIKFSKTGGSIPKYKFSSFSEYLRVNHE